MTSFGNRATVWALYRQHDRVAATVAEPDMDLEGFATLGDARELLTQRMQQGQGVTYYVHPNRVEDRAWTDWPDNDRALTYCSVWLASLHDPDKLPPGWQPDATSEPDEHWTLGPRGGLRRTRY